MHDVSWGTKGDNKVSTDLGVVKTESGKTEVTVEAPTTAEERNAAYEDALHVLQTKPPKVDDTPDSATQQEDYYRTFRTNVLLAWSLSNALLGAAIVYVLCFSSLFLLTLVSERPMERLLIKAL